MTGALLETGGSPAASRGTRVPDGVTACSAPDPAYPRPDGEDRYSISEVATCTGLSAHTLRWYERIGLMPHIDRTGTGQRRYRNRDLSWLYFLNRLRLTGMPVADMVRYAELVRAGEHTVEERRTLLEAHRETVRQRLLEVQDSLAVLDLKIAAYAAP